MSAAKWVKGLLIFVIVAWALLVVPVGLSILSKIWCGLSAGGC